MVCFVVLHYMAVDETIACVESIIGNLEGEKKVILVDNASPNGSGRELKRKYDNNDMVDVLISSENLGFAKGNNLGYQFAIETYHPDFVVVMNNDMEIFQKDFIEKIEQSYQEYRYFILGPDVYSTKKKYHQNPQTRKILSKDELRKKYRKLWLKDKLRFMLKLKWILKKMTKSNRELKSEKKDIPYVQNVVENPLLHGSCYVFSPLFIHKYPTECFYPETFMYMEAEILHYRATKNNEKMIYYPKLKIDHHEDVSTDAIYKDYTKSVFSVKCLLQSTKVFIELMEKGEV